MTDHDHAAQIAAYGRCVACTAAAATPEAPTPREARDDALSRVEAGTPLSWTVQARNAMRAIVGRGEPFTSDVLWGEVNTRPPEPRAMGAIFQWAMEQGMIERTGLTVASTRPEAHGRPVRVWKPALLPSSGSTQRSLLDPETA